jgi:hypothetical protein
MTETSTEAPDPRDDPPTECYERLESLGALLTAAAYEPAPATWQRLEVILRGALAAARIATGEAPPVPPETPAPREVITDLYARNEILYVLTGADARSYIEGKFDSDEDRLTPEMVDDFVEAVRHTIDGDGSWGMLFEAACDATWDEFAPERDLVEPEVDRIVAALDGAPGTASAGSGTGFGHRDFDAVTTDPAAALAAVLEFLPVGGQLTLRSARPWPGATVAR